MLDCFGGFRQIMVFSGTERSEFTPQPRKAAGPLRQPHRLLSHFAGAINRQSILFKPPIPSSSASLRLIPPCGTFTSLKLFASLAMKRCLLGYGPLGVTTCSPGLLL